MQIGTVKIESKLALAPMAGVTDAAFRQICSEKGAGYTVTEERDGGVSIRSMCAEPDALEQGLGASSFTLSFDLPDDGAAEGFYAVFSCENTLRSYSEVANFNVFLSFSGGGKTLECASLLQYAPEEAHTT